MTTDSVECNGVVVEGREVESGEVEVGEIRKTILVEENLKASEDKMSCNGEVCHEEVDDDDNLREVEQCELKLENGAVKSSDHVESEHVDKEIEFQGSENGEKGHDLEDKKNVDVDVVENGATVNIDAQALVDDDDVKVEVHDSANDHEKDPELQCLTNGKSEFETESSENEEEDSVLQVVDDVEEEVETTSVNNEDRVCNLEEEIVGDNNTGLSDLVDEDEGKENVEEDGGNQSEKAESENGLSEEHKLESSEEALPVLDRNGKLENIIAQTLIDDESKHDSEMMNGKCKSLENEDIAPDCVVNEDIAPDCVVNEDIAPDCVVNEEHDWKPQFVLNNDKGPEPSVEDKSIELESCSAVIEENKSEVQCMPNGSMELASHLDVTNDRKLESQIEEHGDKGLESQIEARGDKGLESHIETDGDKGLESHMETHDDKVEEVSNGKDEASELEIGSSNESIIDGASDKSGETSGLNNCIEQPELLEKIAHGADWVSTGDPVPSNSKSVPQISSDEPKLELDVPKKTFYCLVKIPRHVDNKIKTQIRIAELQLNEKTERRDFIRAALTMKRSNKDQILDTLKAARQEENAIRDAIKVKRDEMVPVQSTLNKMKNANSAEEYEEKIYQMEYRISHESMPLSEEKQLIREIKQLKASRNELCANAGPHSELQEAFNHIDKIQDHSKLLGQELETLKKQQFQAQKNRNVIEKEFNEVNDALRQLQVQWRAADAVRQEAYEALRDLKKQEYERNHEFYKNRDDIKEAKQYAGNKNWEALEKLCSNQVERIIEMWNKNAEFRKEYIKDNEQSTLKRLETFDGRALGPDEELPISSNYDEPLDTSLLSQGKPSSSGTRLVRENKSTTTVEQSDEVESKPKALQSPSKETTVLTKKSAGGQQSLPKVVTDPPKKSVGKSKNSGLVTKIEPFEVNSEIFKNEEEDLAKKEEAAKMKETRRLEEMRKAKEAEERKRRLAEKANAKALARAQKEAERKEKERQKRANKKAAAAASAATASDTAENDSATSSGMQNDASRDSKLSSISEARELTSTSQKSNLSQRKKPVSQKVKPAFPAVKKGKKGGQTWMWILLAVVLCLFLVVLWFRF